MHIINITLDNFRNFESETIKFNSFTNAVVGNNAQGKTNLLECIYTLAFGKSFKTNKDVELINYNHSFSKISLTFFKTDREQTIEITLLKNKTKQIKLNGVVISKYIDLIGALNVVFFSPEDLKLIKNGPTERRRFLDREISHLNKKYLDNLINYHKVLNHRNKLIKSTQHNNALINTFDVWDQQLVNYGTHLIKKRIEYIKKLNDKSKDIHATLSENKEDISLLYACSFCEINNENLENIKMDFLEKLKETRTKDVRYGFTGIGPHKDDIKIMINEKDARKYASQGQQRTIALSIKLSEIEIIESELNERPILLLDDVMSELDVQRQTLLMNKIKNLQTILTTTDLHGLNYNKMAPFTLITINDGKVLSSQEVTNVN